MYKIRFAFQTTDCNAGKMLSFQDFDRVIFWVIQNWIWLFKWIEFCNDWIIFAILLFSSDNCLFSQWAHVKVRLQNIHFYIKIISINLLFLQQILVRESLCPAWISLCPFDFLISLQLFQNNYLILLLCTRINSDRVGWVHW